MVVLFNDALMLITLVGHIYYDCHRNKIATLLNVLRVEHLYLCLTMDFGIYKDFYTYIKKYGSTS